MVTVYTSRYFANRLGIFGVAPVVRWRETASRATITAAVPQTATRHLNHIAQVLDCKLRVYHAFGKSPPPFTRQSVPL
jgi:hypothetical protein